MGDVTPHMEDGNPYEPGQLGAPDRPNVAAERWRMKVVELAAENERLREENTQLRARIDLLTGGQPWVT